MVVELRLVNVRVHLRLQRQRTVRILPEDVLIRHRRVETNTAVQLLMFIARRNTGRRRHRRVIVHGITGGVVLVLRQQELVLAVGRRPLASRGSGQRPHPLVVVGVVPRGTARSTVYVRSDDALPIRVELPQQSGSGQGGLLLELLVVGSYPLDRGPLLLLEQRVRTEIRRLVARRLTDRQVFRHGVLEILNGCTAAVGVLYLLRTGSGRVGN